MVCREGHSIPLMPNCRGAGMLPSLLHKSAHGLLFAIGSLNHEFGTNLRFSDVEERVAFLEGQYTTLKKLTQLPETHWDFHKNIIYVDDSVWLRIFKENIFAQAYYHNGEPEHYKMCCLFGADAIKTEPSHTVILINDSPHSKEQVYYYTSDSSSEDEVTSPPARVGTSVSRKLFHGDSSSSIIPPNVGHYHVPWPAIQNKLRYPGRNAFPLKPKDTGEKRSGVGESSCASSNPLK